MIEWKEYETFFNFVLNSFNLNNQSSGGWEMWKSTIKKQNPAVQCDFVCLFVFSFLLLQLLLCASPDFAFAGHPGGIDS